MLRVTCAKLHFHTFFIVFLNNPLSANMCQLRHMTSSEEPSFLIQKWRFFGRGHMSKLTHFRRERMVQKHCKIHIKMQIFTYHMYHRASSFWLKNYKICIWKWALLRSWISIGFGSQKLTKNWQNSDKKVIRKRLEKTHDFKTDF